MAHKVELEDSDVEVIIHLCDVALKNGGISYFGAVARILSLMPKIEKAETVEVDKDG